VSALFVFVVLLPFARAEEKPAAGKPKYPETRKVDAKDVLHGVEVPDPYRWLEDDYAPEVEAWDHAQNAVLRERLDRCPGRAALKERLEAELNQGTLESLPRFAGAFEFHTYRAPGENHAVLYVRDGAGKEPPRVVIDPNAWSADGTQGMKNWWPSPDGRYVAYERDAKGSEDTTIYVHDVETGATLPDVISRAKFSSVAWRPDARSFYYTRMPDPADVPKGEAQYHRRMRMHVLGKMVLDDVTLYGADRPLLESCWVYTSENERHRFLGRAWGSGRVPRSTASGTSTSSRPITRLRASASAWRAARTWATRRSGRRSCRPPRR
jgi:prolyl oligopeptidase